MTDRDKLNALIATYTDHIAVLQTVREVLDALQGADAMTHALEQHFGKAALVRARSNGAPPAVPTPTTKKPSRRASLAAKRRWSSMTSAQREAHLKKMLAGRKRKRRPRKGRNESGGP